jgi:hypothetical protein
MDDYSFNPNLGCGWWEDPEKSKLPDDLTEKARADSLVECARNLENLQREVHEQNLLCAQLYSNRELAAFDWGVGTFYRASLSPMSMTGENLVLSIVDTLVNHVGKNRPKAKPQTRGASWKLRRRARLLDKFLYGEFRRCKVYEVGKQVYRDAAIFGFGCTYTHVKNDKLCVERVFPDEILIDQMEVVACGKPRHIYRRRVLPVEVVAEMFDDVDMDELKEQAKGQEYVDYRTIGRGWIPLVEGWQLALGDGSPGKYMAAAGGMILDEAEWKDERSPFNFYHYSVPPSGFYYGGAVEQALPYQIRLNEINEVIRDAQDIMGRPRLLVAEGSRVNPYEITNVVAKIIKYTGIKPEAVTWPAISAELYNERDRCWGQCREQFGLNDMTSSGQAPAGARFDSSEAFREFNAIQDDRLSDQAQRFETFYLELAETMIRTIKASGKNPKTVWTSGGKRSRMEVIEWSKIDLDEDCYVLQLEATSLYDSSPSAVRDSLEKQLALGLITPEDYRLELSHPDDSAELSLKAAAAADIRRVVELLEEGHWEDPTPVQDLPNGTEVVSLALLNLNQYENDDDEVDLDEIKLNMTNWVVAARAWMSQGAEVDEMSDPAINGAPMPGSPGPMMDPMSGQMMMPPAPMPPVEGAGFGSGGGMNPMRPAGLPAAM